MLDPWPGLQKATGSSRAFVVVSFMSMLLFSLWSIRFVRLRVFCLCADQLVGHLVATMASLVFLLLEG